MSNISGSTTTDPLYWVVQLIDESKQCSGVISVIYGALRSAIQPTFHSNLSDAMENNAYSESLYTVIIAFASVYGAVALSSMNLTKRCSYESGPGADIGGAQHGKWSGAALGVHRGWAQVWWSTDHNGCWMCGEGGEFDSIDVGGR
ncbi:hypothetical protein BD779DRAFT_1789436 [Infundibulicybe gibba]|nr:hypothetical protein BD779DRAFT_1789436 [Infundibulicybe gibba]